MVDRYIRELLIENNRVIVPDFGAFIARVKPDSKEPNVLENKTIVFNDILKFNDGLLVNYIIKIEDTDLTIALQKITDFIQIVSDEFSKGNDYKLEAIGHLHRDKRGNVTLISFVETAEPKKEVIQESSPVIVEKNEELSVPVTSGEAVKEEVIESPIQNEVVPPPIPVAEEIVQPPPIPQVNEEEKPEPTLIHKENEVVVSDKTENSENDRNTISAIENPQVEIIVENKSEEKSETKIEDQVVEKTEVEKPEVTNIERTEEKQEEKLVEKNGKEQSDEKISEQKPVIPAREKREKLSEKKAVDKTEPKEEKVVETKTKPVKPVKKEAVTGSVKKKSPKWLTITVWSVSGLLFLSLVFTASVKFGFIKGVKLFSGDNWISVNEKLHKDLEEFNKKHKDKLTLPELTKDDNKKEAFSGSESAGSFDAPATDEKAADNSSTPVTTASSSEGSFGSFEEPKDTKTTTEKTKETKETKKETATEKNTQTTTSSSSVGATGKYVIVAGSFSNKNAADIFIEQLKKKGYSSAEYVGIKNGMHMTCYGSYNDQKEANAEYQKLRQKGVQTWILNQ